MGSFLYDTFFKSFSSEYCKEFKMYREKEEDIRKTENPSENRMAKNSSHSILYTSM